MKAPKRCSFCRQEGHGIGQCQNWNAAAATEKMQRVADERKALRLKKRQEKAAGSSSGHQ